MELQEKKKNRTEQKTDMQNKEKALLTQLDEIAKQDLCLAFSGGVDSSLLLKLVMDASAKYGTKVYAVTFQTRLHPPCDLETATRVAKEVGAVHEVLFVDELEQERASMFAGADLLVAADCTAYAYGNFHQDFIRDHVVLVGCTKLDDVDYSEKLARIFMRNDIKSITVARMEVPCCAGMERAVKMALKESGKKIPVKTVVISTEGEIL